MKSKGKGKEIKNVYLAAVIISIYLTNCDLNLDMNLL
jgi:hypothetical protein